MELTNPDVPLCSGPVGAAAEASSDGFFRLVRRSGARTERRTERRNASKRAFELAAGL